MPALYCTIKLIVSTACSTVTARSSINFWGSALVSCFWRAVEEVSLGKCDL